MAAKKNENQSAAAIELIAAQKPHQLFGQKIITRPADKRVA
jgi:hypothetical protein